MKQFEGVKHVAYWYCIDVIITCSNNTESLHALIVTTISLKSADMQ